MKLNGYSLKSVKTLETHDGVCISGNVYYSGKQIGSVYDEGRGGTIIVDLSSEYPEHYPVLSEDFVWRLLELKDYEDIFKKNLKKQPEDGTAFVIFANSYNLKSLVCGRSASMDDIRNFVSETMPGKEVKSIEIFRSLDDFNIDQDHRPELYVNADADEDIGEYMDSGIQMT